MHYSKWVSQLRFRGERTLGTRFGGQYESDDAVNLIMKARLGAKLFHMGISFVCISMQFHNKKFKSLVFIMRFKATQKWPILCIAVRSNDANGISICLGYIPMKLNRG